MKDWIYAVLGVITAAIAVWQVIDYVGQKTPPLWQLAVIIFLALVALVFGVMFLLGKVNKEEEIHITK